MRINLSFLIILIMSVLMLLQSTGLYLYMKAHNERILFIETKKELTHDLTRLQGTLEYLFRVGDMAQIEEEISALGASNNVIRAFVMDDNKQIIASINKAHRGTDFSKHVTINKINAFNFPQAKATLNIQYWINKTSKHHNGLAPLILGTYDGSIRPEKIGFLLIEYYPTGLKGVTRQHLLNIALPLIAQSGAVLFILILILYCILFRRIARFNKIAKQVSNGDYNVRINSAGLDDLGALANTFDKTVSNVQLKTMQLSEQYRESTLREENLTITLNSIGDAVITTDAEGKVIRMNEIAEQLTGWKETDALSLPLEEVFHIINAKTRNPVINPVAKVISSNKIIGLANHTALLSKDGSEYQIADSAAPIIDTDGQLIGIILVFHDISLQYALQEEVSQSQELLQSVIDNSPSLISARNLNGDFLLSNKAHAGFLGRTPKEVLSAPFEQIFGQEQAERYTKTHQDALKQNDFPEYEEAFTKDGKAYTLLVSKFKLLRNNSVYGIATIATDISTQKEQAEQLKRSQKMDALGKLTGGIAHDYNNMIGIILGYSELLTPHLENNPKLKSYIANITHAGNRGAELTRQLLSFARLKPGKLAPSKINTLVLNSSDMLQKSLTHKISFKLDLSSDIWESFINPGEFEDALVNLCINAMHAMPEGGTLTIRTNNQNLTNIEATKLELKAGNYIKLSIEDTGLGIDEETQEKVFDPFFTTKGDLGNGLGLSQVYGFVKSVHGAIKLHSVISEGTQFHLYLPRYTHSVENSSGSESKLDSIDTLPNDKNCTVLIVDDEPALADLATEILKAEGYHTHVANTGENALKIAADNKIDLLISDIVMPEMNGYDLAEEITKTTPDIKVLTVSGYSDDSCIKHKNRYPRLQKPYRASMLLKAVKDLIA